MKLDLQHDQEATDGVMVISTVLVQGMPSFGALIVPTTLGSRLSNALFFDSTVTESYMLYRVGLYRVSTLVVSVPNPCTSTSTCSFCCS